MNLTMSHYAAGIVLYHPDINRLKENLDAISPQVNVVYCYNNGLGKDESIGKLLDSYSNVVFLGNGNNDGISKALNCVVEKADEENIEWVLTLDQDSVVCSNMIEALASITNIEKAGIICPQLEDVRRKNETPTTADDSYEDIDICFTSGSFMNVKATKAIGGYDEYLFIDLVDHDICMRMRYEGYRVIRNNAVVLDHELGNLKASRFEKLYLKLGGLLHNETIKKLSYKRAVSPMRVYYATRNMIYMKKKFSKYTSGKMWDKRLIKNSVAGVLRGEHKIKILKAVNKGIRDGKAKKVQPYVARKGAVS